MKNVLIINLRRLGDIYSTGHLINSIKQNSPATTISLLIYKEFENITRSLGNVDQFFFIDRKKITSLRKNPIFSPALAIEKFYCDLVNIQKTNWDQIINFSNDKIGSYLVSYLTADNPNIECFGIKYLTSQTMTRSSDWAIMLNDILPCYTHTPVHFIDCYHHLYGVSWAPLKSNLIKTHPKHDQSVQEVLEKIKKDTPLTNGEIQVVGIQLKSSDTSKDIPAETIIELISLLLDNSKVFPVLLIAPIKQEQDLACDINAYFDNTLVVIESDLYALGSVIKHLNCIITPDTFIKHMCDLTGTPMVEISRGKSPFLKQGTYNINSYILTPALSTRKYEQINLENEGRIKAGDIFQTMQLALKHISISDIKLSSDLTIYGPMRDELGIYYMPISGSYDIEIELSRYLSRYYIKKIFNQNKVLDISFFNDVKNFRLHAWLDCEKNAVTELTRDLLSTLKHLLLSQKNKTKTKEFVVSLERLLGHIEKHHVASIPLHFFKAQVDSLTSDSTTQNVQVVEELLYKLKSDIQQVLVCFKEFESLIQDTHSSLKPVSVLNMPKI